MDKVKYLAIRKSQDLELKPSALFLHFAREALLVSAIVAISFFYSDSLLRFTAIPLISAVIFRNFSLMHDAVHKAVSKKPLINDLIGMFSGGICLLPFEPWRRTHLEHHTWSGNIDKDPVTAIITFFPKLHPYTQGTLSFFWKTWFPMLALMQYGVFYFLATKVFLKNRDSLKVLASLVIPVALWGSAFYFLPQAFSLQVLLPSIVLYMVAVEVVNFPHHLQLPQYRGETRFAVWEQYKIARSCVYPKWFSTWVTLNFNYHVEHHMFPDAPWYHLPKLQALVQPALNSSYNTDPYFAWIIENKPKTINQVIQPVDSPKVTEETAA